MPSLANAKNNKTQGGYIIAISTPEFTAGKLSPFSVITWKSHLIKRIVTASLASEALALADGLIKVDWLRAMWCETMDRGSTIYNSTIFGNNETAV
jgi:hypothetical protein